MAIKGFAVTQRSGSHLKQFDKIMYRLNEEIEGIQGRTEYGMLRAAYYIEEQTLNVVPKTPIDTGNLRASWFVVSSGRYGKAFGKGKKAVGFKGLRSKKNPKLKAKAQRMKAEHRDTVTAAKGTYKAGGAKQGPYVVMGYSAFYASIVHERVGARFRTEGTGPKWFEAHVKSNTKNILNFIRENAKVR